MLREGFADQGIAELTRGAFDVIALNLWGDREVTGFAGEQTTEKAFAAGLKVQFTPTLLMLDEDGAVHFGADVENFYSAHHYQVYKPNPKVLELIV